MQNLSNIKFKLNFNHNADRFFIYFQTLDLLDKSIYSNTQQFETIEFIVNGYNAVKYDYTTLLYDNSKNVLGYELPIGVFEIKWNSIKWKNLSQIDNFQVVLNGLMVPSNIGFVIGAESINSLIYYKNRCGLAFMN